MRSTDWIISPVMRHSFHWDRVDESDARRLTVSEWSSTVAPLYLIFRIEVAVGGGSDMTRLVVEGLAVHFDDKEMLRFSCLLEK
jgi:hypothetical protein